MTDKKRALLAAGGTGGHLFPALALAEELIKQGWEVMIATDERGARYDKSELDYETVVISSATTKPGLWGKFQTAAALGKGITQSFKIMRNYKPDVIVGFGGYPCFPPLFAAQLLKKPTIIHEANAVLGKANKMLAARASHIAMSTPATKGVSEHKTFAPKSVVTGNPVRAKVVAKQSAPYMAPTANGPFNIFVMGGSQGAHVFSKVIPEAIKHLSDADQKRIRIVQQCREEDMPAARKAFEEMGVDYELKAFFDNAPEELEKCHLFIGRSGASTVSDVAVVGRPAIFAPLKHADNQQLLNAKALADAGGAWVIPSDQFDAKTLAKSLATLMADPNTLKAAADKSAQAGEPFAASKLKDLVIKAAR